MKDVFLLPFSLRIHEIVSIPKSCFLSLVPVANTIKTFYNRNYFKTIISLIFGTVSLFHQSLSLEARLKHTFVRMREEFLAGLGLRLGSEACPHSIRVEVSDSDKHSSLL
jgi:hypothetical protein